MELTGDIQKKFARGSALPETTVHDILRNDRRRMAIGHLQASDGRATLRQLADDIAAAESDESPPPRRVRDSVYVSLHQTHLPKLDDLGVLKYDDDRKTVELDDGASQLRAYANVVTDYGFTWAAYYRVVATVALSGIALAEISLPGSNALPLSALFLGFLLVSGVYQFRQRRFGTSTP